MTRLLLVAALLLAALVLRQPAIAEREMPVDLELVLAVDVSGSIDLYEARLQRQGYIDALASTEVVRAITAGRLGRAAITYVEWAGNGHFRLLADWRLIDGPAAAHLLATQLAEAPIISGRRTSISGAVQFALPLFEGNGYRGTRRIIDISGDGPNNNGFPVLTARENAIAAGVGINGLVILNQRPGPLGFPIMEDLDIYYEECVIAGQGAFVLVADGFEDFARAIKRKLVLEIAGIQASDTAVVRRVASYDCLVGERQLREWLRNNPFDQ